MRCLLTVDKDDTNKWKGYTGVVTTLFDKIKIDSSNTFAAVCGPPIVYKYVLKELLDLKFSKGRILMSLERKMKCGIGKCGHCGVGAANKYVCIDGPIFDGHLVNFQSLFRRSTQYAKKEELSEQVLEVLGW